MPKPSERPQALTEDDFKIYLNIKTLLSFYKDINKAGSLESAVCQFYATFLPLIFTPYDGFGIAPESRTSSFRGSTGKTDCSITYITNGRPKRIIICEHKRRDKASQASAWSNALEQVLQYALTVRVEDGHRPEQTLYLTVNIGTYLRFYELPGDGTNQVQDWAPGGGRLYELADDEEEV